MSALGVFPDGEQLGRVLNDALRQHHVSRARAAEAMRIGSPTLGRRLAGKSPLRVVNIVTVAELTGMQPGDLYRAAEELAAAEVCLAWEAS